MKRAVHADFIVVYMAGQEQGLQVNLVPSLVVWGTPVLALTKNLTAPTYLVGIHLFQDTAYGVLSSIQLSTSPRSASKLTF